MKKKDVKGLIEKWVQEGSLSQEQANKMVTDIDNLSYEKSSMSFISIISIIGASALGLGVLLLIASNWDSFGRTMQLILGLLLPIIPLSVTYWFMVEKQSKSILYRATNVLGVGLIAGMLAIIHQVYNLEAKYFNFILIWTILSAPFIYVFRKVENAFLTIVLFGATILAFFVEQVAEYSYMDEEQFFVTITLVYLAYCALLYLSGLYIKNFSGWTVIARMMRILSGLFSIVVLYITTFMFYAEVVVDAFDWTRASEYPLSIFLNIFFLSFLVFVLFIALKKEEYGVAAVAIRWFGIYLITKYITLFSDMLDTGVFFVIGGVIFISGGIFLEKNKGVLIKYMRGHIGVSPENPNMFSE